MSPAIPVDNDAKEFTRALQRDVLARTLWGEARGEGSAGMAAVACVILNRVKTATAKGGYWWGDDVIAVCQKPFQFSCWNKDDPNFRKLLAVHDGNQRFKQALAIADKALDGKLKDQTGGADHYHAAAIIPYWAKDMDASAHIGRHVFYRLVT
jgi:N-acetylmuramoyl-L-alanine amidase